MWSETVCEYAANPRNLGPFDGYTHKGVAGDIGEGPYVVIWLKVTQGIIEQAAFRSNGCPAALASGGMLTVLVTRRLVESALTIEPPDLIRILGGLPEGKQEYAVMAIDALHRAICVGEQNC